MTTTVDWEERTRIAADAAKELEVADHENDGKGILPSAKYMKAGIHSIVADIVFYAGGNTIEDTYILVFGDMIIVYYGDNQSIEFLVVEHEGHHDFVVISKNGKREEVITADNFHTWFANLPQWLQEQLGIIEKEEDITESYEDLVDKPMSLPDL